MAIGVKETQDIIRQAAVVSRNEPAVPAKLDPNEVGMATGPRHRKRALMRPGSVPDYLHPEEAGVDEWQKLDDDIYKFLQLRKDQFGRMGAPPTHQFIAEMEAHLKFSDAEYELGSYLGLMRQAADLDQTRQTFVTASEKGTFHAFARRITEGRKQGEAFDPGMVKRYQDLLDSKHPTTYRGLADLFRLMSRAARLPLIGNLREAPALSVTVVLQVIDLSTRFNQRAGATPEFQIGPMDVFLGARTVLFNRSVANPTLSMVKELVLDESGLYHDDLLELLQNVGVFGSELTLLMPESLAEEGFALQGNSYSAVELIMAAGAKLAKGQAPAQRALTTLADAMVHKVQQQDSHKDKQVQSILSHFNRLLQGERRSAARVTEDRQQARFDYMSAIQRAGQLAREMTGQFPAMAPGEDAALPKASPPFPNAAPQLSGPQPSGPQPSRPELSAAPGAPIDPLSFNATAPLAGFQSGFAGLTSMPSASAPSDLTSPNLAPIGLAGAGLTPSSPVPAVPPLAAAGQLAPARPRVNESLSSLVSQIAAGPSLLREPQPSYQAPATLSMPAAAVVGGIAAAEYEALLGAWDALLNRIRKRLTAKSPIFKSLVSQLAKVRALDTCLAYGLTPTGGRTTGRLAKLLQSDELRLRLGVPERMSAAMEDAFSMDYPGFLASLESLIGALYGFKPGQLNVQFRLRDRLPSPRPGLVDLGAGGGHRGNNDGRETTMWADGAEIDEVALRLIMGSIQLGAAMSGGAPLGDSDPFLAYAALLWIGRRTLGVTTLDDLETNLTLLIRLTDDERGAMQMKYREWIGPGNRPAALVPGLGDTRVREGWRRGFERGFMAEVKMVCDIADWSSSLDGRLLDLMTGIQADIDRACETLEGEKMRLAQERVTRILG